MSLGFVLSKDRRIIKFDMANGAVFGICTSYNPNVSTDAVGRFELIQRLMSEHGAEKFVLAKPNNGQVKLITSQAIEYGGIQISADSIVLEENGIFGAFVHAGHPQLFGHHILGNTIDILEESYFSPVDFQAAVYSGICQKCFEVRGEFIENLHHAKIGRQFKFVIISNQEPGNGVGDFSRSNFHGQEQFLEGLVDLYRLKKGSAVHYEFDLKKTIIRLLRHHGLEPDTEESKAEWPQGLIDTIDLCPHCTDWAKLGVTDLLSPPPLFSHRHGHICRNLIFAMLPGSKIMLFSWTGDCPYVLIY